MTINLNDLVLALIKIYEDNKDIKTALSYRDAYNAYVSINVEPVNKMGIDNEVDNYLMAISAEFNLAYEAMNKEEFITYMSHFISIRKNVFNIIENRRPGNKLMSLTDVAEKMYDMIVGDTKTSSNIEIIRIIQSDLRDMGYNKLADIKEWQTQLVHLNSKIIFQVSKDVYYVLAKYKVMPYVESQIKKLIIEED